MYLISLISGSIRYLNTFEDGIKGGGGILCLLLLQLRILLRKYKKMIKCKKLSLGFCVTKDFFLFHCKWFIFELIETSFYWNNIFSITSLSFKYFAVSNFRGMGWWNLGKGSFKMIKNILWILTFVVLTPPPQKKKLKVEFFPQYIAQVIHLCL